MADIQVHTGAGLAAFAAGEAVSSLWFRVEDTPDTIELTADVEGYEEDDLDLLLDGDRLTVTGYHQGRRTPAWNREDDDGDSDPASPGFSNSFAVPAGILASQIEAELFEGVLTIIIEKPLDDEFEG